MRGKAVQTCDRHGEDALVEVAGVVVKGVNNAGDRVGGEGARRLLGGR